MSEKGATVKPSSIATKQWMVPPIIVIVEVYFDIPTFPCIGIVFGSWGANQIVRVNCRNRLSLTGDRGQRESYGSVVMLAVRRAKCVAIDTGQLSEGREAV